MLVGAEEKPTIAVMDSESHFNITRGATFTDITFRGDYGLLKDKSNDENKQYVKHCEIDETKEAEFTKYSLLQFTEATSTLCAETGFQAAEVDVTDDRESCFFTQTIGSVRACSGEPYSSDYDTTFGGGRVRYLRRKVLFNLYNFDLESSRYKQGGQIPVVSLTLTNCDFKYFLDDYEALIYVETSIVERVDTLFSRPFIVQLGDDRGARITIEESTFKHSSFCKGLIVYREMPELLPYDNEYLVVNFSNEAGKRVEHFMDRTQDDNFGENGLPQISIKDSTFLNLNHGKNMTHLSLVENEY